MRKDPEARREYLRLWRRRHPDYDKRQYEKRRERQLEQQRVKYATDPDYKARKTAPRDRRAYNAEYYARNKEAINARRRKKRQSSD